MKKLGRWSSPEWLLVVGNRVESHVCVLEISYMSGSLLSSSDEHYETCSPHPGGDGGIRLRWLGQGNRNDCLNESVLSKSKEANDLALYYSTKVSNSEMQQQ